MSYTKTHYAELQKLYHQVKHLSNMLSIPFSDAAQLVMLHLCLDLAPKVEPLSEQPSTPSTES